MSKTSSFQNTLIGFIGLAILFIVLVLADIFLYSRTMVELWIPLIISIAGAILLWFIMRYVWELLLPNTSESLRFLLHTLFFTAVVGCIILVLNRAGAEGTFTSDQSVAEGLFDWPVKIKP